MSDPEEEEAVPDEECLHPRTATTTLSSSFNYNEQFSVATRDRLMHCGVCNKDFESTDVPRQAGRALHRKYSKEAEQQKKITAFKIAYQSLQAVKRSRYNAETNNAKN